MEIWRQSDLRIVLQATERGIKAVFQYRTTGEWEFYAEAKFANLAELCRGLPSWKRTAVRDVTQFLNALETVPDEWP